MSKKADKPLAKSLHTVTVLVRMAEFIITQENGEIDPEAALEGAMHALGLSEKADPYGLREAALKQLEA